jgi:lysophospholipase L1-like esterase
VAKRTLAGIVAAGCWLFTAAAQAQAPLELATDQAETGYVGLRLTAPAGGPVTIAERVRGVLEPLATVTPEAGVTTIPRAAAWECGRRSREFVATAADGRSASTTTRTPGCAARLAVGAPRRARPGDRIAVRVRDRWALGDADVRVCARPPGGGGTCTGTRAGGEPSRVHVRLSRIGVWRLRVVAPWRTETRHVRVRRPGDRSRLLVTGDSMIQPLDEFLRTRLRPRGMRVTSEPEISTGISKPGLLDWPAHARGQAAAVRPDVTVMLLGANDGFAMGDALCCGADWVAEYARRARGMMETYARGGRGRVYWALLPAPRPASFQVSFRAVNAALREAARAAGPDVRLLRFDRYFTPGGAFRQDMRAGGRVQRVRQADGVHLTAAGASLAAGLVVRALRRERVLG